jgi:CoA:oxalate CoA-transferase
LIGRGFSDPRGRRDAIRNVIAAAMPARQTADWLSILQPADIWCAQVLDWAALRSCPVWGQLQMERHLTGQGSSMTTIRAPLRLNGRSLGSSRPALALGADTGRIRQELAAPRGATPGRSAPRGMNDNQGRTP